MKQLAAWLSDLHRDMPKGDDAEGFWMALARSGEKHGLVQKGDGENGIVIRTAALVEALWEHGSQLDPTRAIDVFSHGWNLLDMRCQLLERVGFDVTSCRAVAQAFDQLLDRHFHIDDLWQRLGQLDTTKVHAGRHAVSLVWRGEDGGEPRSGEPCQFTLAVSRTRGDESVAVYLLQQDVQGQRWDPFYPNRFDHGLWLIPDETVTIPGPASPYRLFFPQEPPRLKAIITTESVSFPLYVRTTRRGETVLRQRQFREARYKALGELLELCQKRPGLVGVVDV